MFNIALPTITNEFKLQPSQAGWIVTGYIIVYAIGSVMFGKLADKYKLKNLLTVGLLIFALGSFVGFSTKLLVCFSWANYASNGRFSYASYIYDYPNSLLHT